MIPEPSFNEFLFFDGRPAAFELYRIFARKLFEQFPDAGMKVQKTQITFTNPKVFACVSLAKVRKAVDRPREYIVVTLGLQNRIQSPRIDISTEPYPGRWTHHIMIGSSAEIDGELMHLVQEAYQFSRMKRRNR